MLNVPDLIKELLKNESVHKKITIVFPNGERKNITNKNIVTESLSFTESVCSQEQLKFGLCEGSVLQFETVGIENIQDMTIDARIEVDVTEYAKDKAQEECEEDEISKDICIGYRSQSIIVDFDLWYYPIPLGRFIVYECKRKAGALNNRLIEAHSENTYDNFELADIEGMNTLIESYCWMNELDDIYMDFEDVMMLTFKNYAYKNHKDEFRLLSRRTESDNITLLEAYDKELNYMVEIQATAYKERTYSYLQSKDTNKIISYKIENANKNYEQIKDKIIEILSKYGCSRYIGKIPDINDIKNNKIYTYDTTYETWSGTQHKRGERKENLVPTDDDYLTFLLLGKYKGTYPNYDSTYLSNGIMYINTITVYAEPYRDVIEKVDFNPDIKIYKYTKEINTIDNDGRITLFDKTKRENKYNITNNMGENSIDAIRTDYVFNVKTSNMRDIIEAQCELEGSFGQFKRDGEFIFETLGLKTIIYPNKNIYPRDTFFPGNNSFNVSKQKYSEVWYDDFAKKKYNKVVCNYKNLNKEEKFAEYIIVDLSEIDEEGNLKYNPKDFQEYDISNNYLIKNCVYSEEKMNEILENLGNNIRDVEYRAIEVNMQGTPYLEANDIIRVDTDEGPFDTYVLRRQMQGIQTLKDTIESN